jgi:hypothetical protein
MSTETTDTGNSRKMQKGNRGTQAENSGRAWRKKTK